MERFLARLFHASAPWLLKGGYALELRLHPRARTTRDIDLNYSAEDGSIDWARLREELQAAADRELDDYFVFRLGAVRKELQGAPLGGARLPVEARVAGREFCRFHVDVGVGDAVTGEPEELLGQDYLDFADIPPARVRLVPVEQMIAEKVHAYVLPRGERENTRVRDLVDLLLLFELALPDPQQVRSAVERTFATRGGLLVPQDLPAPPESWRVEFEALAQELNMLEQALDEGFARLREAWRAVWSA